MNNYRIRRDQSSLSRGSVFSGKRSNRLLVALVVLSSLVFAGVIAIFSQFGNVQLAALSLIGVAPTVTPTAVEYAKRGEIAFWSGDLEAAINNYRISHSLLPSEVGIAYELARMLIYHSSEDPRNIVNLDEASALADAVIEANPRVPRAVTLLCFAQSSNSQPEAAVRTCTQAIELNDQDADAQAFLARALLNSSRAEEGIVVARRALELDPENIDANTVFGEFQFNARRYDVAYTAYQKAASINSRLIFPYFNLALVNRTMGNALGDPKKIDEALANYNTILSINRRNVKAYVRLCQTYLGQGEFNLANDNCRTATDLDPESTESWWMLGRVAYLNSRYDEAIAAFAQCEQREQNFPAARRETECWSYHALSHVLLNRCEKALPLLYDLLTWTSDPDAIRLANIGLDQCGGSGTPRPSPEAATATPLTNGLEKQG